MKHSLLLLTAVLVIGCTSKDAPDAYTAQPEAPVAVTGPDPGNVGRSPEGVVPASWRWRFDRGSDYTVGTDADSADTYFVTMTPGWHLTTKPAGIFYHPDGVGSGNFTASTQIYLFDPGDRNEGYGMIVGGSDLEGPDQQYLYFLVRRSGEFLIKVRRGAETEDVQGWTAHEAVAAWTEGSGPTLENVLSVAVGDETITFSVNGAQVASIPRADRPTDGVVGLRINHGTNVHVADLSVAPAA
ncbi:MAG: hypothetical protein ACI80V_003632 [Rhodothermales bacterium]|jgi:hypothetical protein